MYIVLPYKNWDVFVEIILKITIKKYISIINIQIKTNGIKPGHVGYDQ